MRLQEVRVNVKVKVCLGVPGMENRSGRVEAAHELEMMMDACMKVKVLHGC